jgi:uncharacterized protein YwgA
MALEKDEDVPSLSEEQLLLIIKKCNNYDLNV